ncbi:hypothetical protein BX666DRAFT_1959433 [Dichotomocladium elegans]|nr:hypothetical protein BX666DRAFT_1959433 [Dichotomocladium elegans]
MDVNRLIPKNATWHEKKKVQLITHDNNSEHTSSLAHHHCHHHQQQQHHHHHHHHHHRSRADTMPSQSTSFPYTSPIELTLQFPPAVTMASAAITSRNRSGSATFGNSPFGEGIFTSASNVNNNWGSNDGITVQSPTTPTTAQLLEGEGNTIASTLASLGLDDERADKRQPAYSTLSHSSQRSSWRLNSSATEHQQENQQMTHTDAWGPPIAETMVAFPATAMAVESLNIDQSYVIDKFQPQTGRPRAISMSVTGSGSAGHQHVFTSAPEGTSLGRNSNLLAPPYRSIWHPTATAATHQLPARLRSSSSSSNNHERPVLRTSSSSADLLELMARQRAGDEMQNQQQGDWDPIQFRNSKSQTNSSGSGNNGELEYVASGTVPNATEPAMSSSSGKTSPQIPTRSLWLGNIDPTITSQDLSMTFCQFGNIESVRILPDRECAFVNFSSVEEALRAKDELVNKLNNRLGNSIVKVGFGKPEQSPQQVQQVQLASSLAATVANGDLNAAATNAQEPTRALWIGNIPSTTTYTLLYSIFSPFGPIESVRVLTHKNCGFVNFESLEDAMVARKTLQNTEIMGPNTGPVRIGFAKVPVKAVSAGFGGTDEETIMAAPESSATTKYQWASSSVLAAGATSTGSAPNSSGNNVDDYHQTLLMYMMAEMGTTNIYAAVARERHIIMSQLGNSGTGDIENDGPHFDELHLPINYYSNIAAAPELGQTRKIDIARLRDIRKRLDTGYVPVQELEVFAIECLDEIVELCSDYIGNTVIQRLFERCSEPTKSRMLEVVAPYLASIGIHKNGTWAAQKIIDTGRLPDQIDRICESIFPYVPALLLDQFGNYVVQCCLGLGPDRNQFIFDAIVDNCWEIAQGRFGARAVRATLESLHVTKRQQRYVAATIIQHASMLATNANGALLLIWLLDTSGIPGRYRVLAPRLTQDKRNLIRLCTHKLASLTVLKIINQRQEPEARALILDALIFSSTDPVIDDILMDQVHGVNLIQKILSSSYVELRERQCIADRVKQVLNKHKLQHVQGYKRLTEEINMVMGDSNPAASLGTLPGLVPTTFTMNPEIAAVLHAKYLAAVAATTTAAASSNKQASVTEKIAKEEVSGAEVEQHTSNSSSPLM